MLNLAKINQEKLNFRDNLQSNRTYNIASRIFYTFSFICTTLAFLFYVYRAYKKWKIIPDIVIRKNQKFLGEIPFPAVTICSPVFSRPELLYYPNYSSDTLKSNIKVLAKITPNEANYYISNMQACNPSYTAVIEVIKTIQTRNNTVELLNESFLSVDEVFAMCHYAAKLTECKRLFNRVLTDRGFCYSFNMQGFNTIFNADVISDDFNSYKRRKISKSPYKHHDLHSERINDDNETVEWTLDKGFIEDHDNDIIPVAADKNTNLGIYLFVDKNNLENSCTKYANTFNYYFHLPNEISTQMHKKHFIPINEKNIVTLTANVVKTSNELRKLKPIARGCYFEGERKLKFFNSYTKLNCEFECMTNYTLKICGCLKFSMPRDKNTPICNIDKILCYFDAMSYWPGYNLTTKQIEASCGCLDTCSDIKYSILSIETTPMSMNKSKFLMKNGFEQEDALSYLAFIFENIFITEEESYAPYAIQNFIADIGGLLGLFIGCSILSIFEFVFYIVYKTTDNIKIFKDKMKFVDDNKGIIIVKPFQNHTDSVMHEKLQNEHIDKFIQQLRQEFEIKLHENQLEILKILNEKLN
ncbi:hypothetical protein PVAND_010014 [Polypedilum vanderplanki]|uniref:Uncharacterized protein n=1 Tax=Polypedilum vanderplanki TaxID=319348 RepID=A0A9J6CFE7_POLVA|nr:hypothetical protein PVAND_010014 [Polypedilum vanderplanki]